MKSTWRISSKICKYRELLNTHGSLLSSQCQKSLLSTSSSVHIKFTSISSSEAPGKSQKSEVLSTGSKSPTSEESKQKKPKVSERKTGLSETEATGNLADKKTSFVKELLLGRFDTNVLTFPEALDKERHETLHEMLEPIERFFREEVDSKKIDSEAKIPDKVLKGLKELGLYGQQIPLEFGGLGLNATEYARIQEIISLDGGIAVTMAAHQAIGFKGILLYGTDEQKQKYLPKFASGEWLAAFALTEPNSGSDAGSVSTKATLSADGKTWLLNGSKIWISNGGTADFFTVFAKTADDVVTEKSPKRVTAFLVERKFGGVTNGKPEDKLGIRGSNTSEVYFENTPVPAENVLGEVGDGFKVAVNILNSGRFSMGSAVAGGMKKLMAVASEYATTRKQFGRPLMDFGLIKEKFGRVAIQTYAMESMAYVTAGMLDSNEYKDCAVEAAIVKVYSSEAGWEAASELLQVFGGSGYMKDLPFERYLRDTRILAIFEGTNEILRLFIALMGLQHAGKEMKELVKKLRNPFLFPTFAFQTIGRRMRHQRDNPKLTLKLNDYLHPSLSNSGDELEYSVLRLQFAVELILQRHGSKVAEPDVQLELKRLADNIIDIYAMTCVLARASRSYCIGIPNAETEVLLAQTFVREATDRCRRRVLQISNNETSSALLNDKAVMDIADLVFKNKGYFAEHPLTKTFW